jgi:hypothetical protein
MMAEKKIISQYEAAAITGLSRMLGPKGNPRANNLLAMIGKLQRVSGVRLAVGTGAKKRAA